MDKKKTVFDFLGQIMILFGFMMLVMNLFCLFFGDSAKSISSLFELGSLGLSVKTAFQFLLIAALITGLRILFFTDTLIKKMPIWLRMLCMLSSVVLVIAAFILMFHWFPADRGQLWAMFFLCFGVSFLGSYLFMTLREKSENRQMEEALRRLKETEEKRNE